MVSSFFQEEQQNEKHLGQLASVGQIAAGIAHEVRNPLTAVKGFLQLLQQEDSKDYVEIALSELDNALITLNNMLQVSKPDQDEEEKQFFHIVVELESIINLFQDKQYDVKVKTYFQDTGVAIWGRKNQFKKALFNLMKNAFEAIEGEGTITISHSATDKEVIISIEDTGVGIPKEKLSLLGTPFFTTKDQGTGMGLTQVFSVVYQHGGEVIVDSEENRGTTFTIKLPKQEIVSKRGVRKMALEYKEDIDIKGFFIMNRDKFEEQLLTEAINVKEKIEEIRTVENINLMENAHKLVLYVTEEREHELISFAKEEGIEWAKHSMTLAFKLEWIHAIRRTLWDFLYNYERLLDTANDREHFFTLEKKINVLMDQFLNHFFISYSKYKDELLKSQRELVEDLSVPIIPLTASVCILPLIGTIDQYRINTIEDKVINKIGNAHIQTLIIDLSGVARMENEVIQHLIKIIDGISMMGCRTILTGIRAEIVKIMISLGLSFEKKAEAKGTLQLALLDFLKFPNEQIL